MKTYLEQTTKFVSDQTRDEMIENEIDDIIDEKYADRYTDDYWDKAFKWGEPPARKENE